MTLTEAAHVAQIDITAGGGAAAARDHYTGWDNPATVPTRVPQFWHRCIVYRYVCRQVCVCPIPSAVSPATPATLIPRVSQIPPTSIPIWMGASSLGRASSATSSFRSGHLIQHATTWRADTSSVYSLHMLTSSSFCGHGNVQQFVQFLFSVSYPFLQHHNINEPPETFSSPCPCVKVSTYIRILQFKH